MLKYTDDYVSNKAREWTSHINHCRINVMENFEEMDFRNADARVHMEKLVSEIEMECLKLINTINSL